MEEKIEGSYLFKHWISTMLIAPFLSDLFFYINPVDNKIGGLINGYFIVLIMSFILSLPTYIIYAAVFYHFKKKQFSAIFSKKILIAISATGVFITFMLSFPGGYLHTALAYMLVSLVTGIFFNIKQFQ